MMTYTYEEITHEDTSKILKRTSNNGQIAWIPLDETNSDYQRYLRWLENPDAEESGTL